MVQEVNEGEHSYHCLTIFIQRPSKCHFGQFNGIVLGLKYNLFYILCEARTDCVSSAKGPREHTYKSLWRKATADCINIM